MKEKWCVVLHGGGLGDFICFISAVRQLARTRKDIEVGIDIAHPITSFISSLYNDDLVSLFSLDDKDVKQISLFNNGNIARQHDGWKYVGNYHGVYLANILGYLPPSSCPNPPELPKIKGILKGKIGIQLVSNWAKNPSDDFIQRIVDICKEHTGDDVIALGKIYTRWGNIPRHFKNMNYDFIKEDIPFLMSCINELGLLLTPRSGCAHIAAGYQTPTIEWTPNDGEEWHTNYYPWNVLKVGIEILDENKIKSFIKSNIIV
jgi:hypothetical protein